MTVRESLLYEGGGSVAVMESLLYEWGLWHLGRVYCMRGSVVVRESLLYEGGCGRGGQFTV